MFAVDFSFVDQVELHSRMRSSTRKGLSLTGAQTQRHERPDAARLYAQLAAKTPLELQATDVFALWAWKQGDWQHETGRAAMRHLWQLALQQPIIKLLMLLRVLHADNERWPGPRPVIQAMADELKHLIASQVWDVQADLIGALMAGDGGKRLATLAFGRHQSVQGWLEQAKLPTRLEIVSEAAGHWLGLWIQAPMSQRQPLQAALQETLATAETPDARVRLARRIFDSPHLPSDPRQLVEKVKHYPELVSWLSDCARKIDFKRQFTGKDAAKLTCWIGVGNYAIFGELIEKFLWRLPNETSINAQRNRYKFWNDYKEKFEGFWFLLPPGDYLAARQKYGHLTIKEVKGFKVPLVVFKISDYFIVQPFGVKATEADVLLIEATEDLWSMLSEQDRISYGQLKEQLVMIHDQMFLWQVDLASILRDRFGIKGPVGQTFRDHAQQLDRRKKVAEWLKQAAQRYSREELRAYALPARIHGLA